MILSAPHPARVRSALVSRLAASSVLGERFLAEARLLRRISSPRVIGVHDVGLTDGQPYFVMDYISGGTLADLLAGRSDERLRATAGSLSPLEALSYGAEVALAAQVIHDAGSLHRDIKPGNVLLDLPGVPSGGDWRVLMADLGLAKSLAESSGYTVTAGTPAYVAPEQVGGEALDARVDVYSVAAVTYELLTGRPPYVASGMQDVLRRDRVLRPALVAGQFGLTRSVDDLLARSLSYNPADRPATASELARELLQLAAELDVPADSRPTVLLGRSASMNGRSASTNWSDTTSQTQLAGEGRPESGAPIPSVFSPSQTQVGALADAPSGRGVWRGPWVVLATGLAFLVFAGLAYLLAGR